MSSDIQSALEVNKVYQEALIQHAEQMETQLTEVDGLLSEVGTYDETDNANLVPVYVEGAIRFKAPVSSSLLLKPDSPFYAEAIQRTRYCYNSSPHPMRSRELRTLSDAVKQENQRSNVLGLPSPLDWEKVAKQVSLCSNAKHSAEEYRIKWLGEERVVSNSNKTIEPTSSHQRRVLPEGFDTKLTEAVQIYGLDNWSLVARFISENTTPDQCEGRYLRSLNQSVKKGIWTKEEDDRLCVAVEAYGNSWIDVACAMPGRTNDQCRERWVDQLKNGITTSNGVVTQFAASLYLIDTVAGKSLGRKRQKSAKEDPQCPS